MYNVAFYGKGVETTGSIGQKVFESKNGETTGTVGYYNFDSQTAPNLYGNLSKDTVSFQGYDQEEKSSSTLGTTFGVMSMAALAVIGCGYAHKTNAVSKISNENIKNLLKHSDKITEPCYKLCSFVKRNGIELYKKVFSFAK